MLFSIHTHAGLKERRKIFYAKHNVNQMWTCVCKYGWVKLERTCVVKWRGGQQIREGDAHRRLQ